MSCPTCDHTMHCVGRAFAGGRVFWCPRCGTLDACPQSDGFAAQVPVLVQRLRVDPSDDPAVCAHQINSIGECIYLPHERPNWCPKE